MLTEALFRASAAPRLTPFARRKDVVAVVFGLMAVAAVVLIPAYLVAWPFRWFGAETLGVRVQNGMALFTLFGWTTGMLLHMRDRRNEAKQTCESARRSSG